MGPNRYLIDTNIISKLFEGSLSAKAVELLNDLSINEQYISIINRIELLSWKELKGEKLKDVNTFIAEINELALSEDIVARTIKIRKGMISFPMPLLQLRRLSMISLYSPIMTKISVVFPD